MVAAAVDWTTVIAAFIAALPAIIAAVYAGRVHSQIRTPSGKPLGMVAEYAHDTAIANNLLLSRSNGPTTEAAPGELHAQGAAPPQVPAETQPPASGGAP